MADHDLEALLTDIGIKLGRSTDWEVYGYCPGHKEILGRADRTPGTWSVARTTGNHYCFSCGYGGTLVDLILDRKGGTPWGALTRMREYGIDLSDPDDLPESFFENRRRTADVPDHLGEHELARFVDPPLKVLKKRCLTPVSAKHYGVRWDAERRCWITPIRLVGGALLGWQEKNERFFNNHPKKVAKSKTLFGIDVLPANATAILVESPLDVCRLHSAGFLGGVSSFGVMVSDDQMRLLLSVTDELILALDNDDNGLRETRHLLTGEPRGGKFKKKGIPWLIKFADIRVFNYGESDAKDPGEMAADEIEWGIENAVPAEDWSM